MTQSSPSGNFSTFKKKSQKERKHERTRTLSMEIGPKEQQPVEELKPSCPWGKAPQQTTSVKSFRDMLNEEKPTISDGPVSTSHTSKGSRQGNPWGSVQVKSSKPADVKGFANILNVQKEEKKNLIEQAKKPLSTIQIEERAIEELKRFYELRAHQ